MIVLYLYAKLKRDQRSLSPPFKDAARRHCLQVRKRDFTRTKLSSNSILGFLAPELGEINFYSLSHSVYDILLWRPELTNTSILNT